MKCAGINMKWKWIGGVMLALAAAGVAMNLKDLRRYIKLSTM